MRENKSSRRKLLKSIGAATIAIGGVSTSSSAANRRGKQDPSKIVDQSFVVREKTGSRKKWKQFLVNRGFSVGSKHVKLSFPAHGSGESNDGGVGTQEIAYEDLDAWISMVHYCSSNYYYSELSWQYLQEVCCPHSVGEDPVDVVGIGFESDKWEYRTGSLDDLKSSSYVSYRSGTSGSGPGFNVDDDQIYIDGQTDSTFYAGVELEPIGNYTQPQRKVQAAYSHTYDVSILDVGVGYPFGVSVDVDNENREWVRDTDQNGNFLRIAQDEARQGYYC